VPDSEGLIVTWVEEVISELRDLYVAWLSDAGCKKGSERQNVAICLILPGPITSRGFSPRVELALS
jgi:hypothetical protein